MAREPIPTSFFVIAVVQKHGRFLLVQEKKFGNRWYFPAGRVEPGESFVQAACRETLEESGIPVQITGLIRIEHTPSIAGARLRVVFVAEPIDDTPPKQNPDEESLRATWVKLDELGQFPLRGDDVREAFQYVARGGRVYPLSIIEREGTPF